MKPLILSASTPTELENRLSKALSAEHKYAQAIVFATEENRDPALLKIFKDRGIAVFGSSSAEEIAGDKLYQSHFVCMLLDLPAEAFILKTIVNQDDSEALGNRIGQLAVESFADPALLLLVGGAGIAIDIEAMLRGLFAVEAGLPVFGGLASSQKFSASPPVFDENDYYDDAVIALVLDRERIELQGLAVSGWSDVGTPKRITRSKGNIVYEIEYLPATDFYQQYFSLGVGIDDQILTVSEYPIRVTRNDGSQVIRAAIQSDAESRALIFGGPIPEGSLVRFCSPNIAQTMRQTIGEIQEFKSQMSLQNADAALLFDCAIRSRAFGSLMQREVQAIQSLWNLPMLGFSSWGEIGNAPGESCNFHNTVVSMVLIRDKQTSGASKSGDLSQSQVDALIDDFEPNVTIENLKEEIVQLRKQKSMLSNFLHFTTADLEREQKRSDELLLNILPGSIAARLKSGQRVIADGFQVVTILFADLVGFTDLSARLPADDLVRMLNILFSSFDELTLKYGVEKIKTIGDAYMAVAGLPEENPEHAWRAVLLARGKLKVLNKFNKKYNLQLQLRIGLNSGPVVAGVIGKRKFSYDLWGDAVNVASRMESHGEPGRIHVSTATAELLKNSNQFCARYTLESRGAIDVKGKGMMETYFVKEASP